MTSLEAKRTAVALSRTNNSLEVDIYGHAAAELRVNFKHPKISSDVVQSIIYSSGLSKENFNKLDTLYTYISWFPKSKGRGFANTGRMIDHEDRLAFLNNVKDEDLKLVKERALRFLGKEYEAVNSNFDDDKYQYGQPSLDRIFSFTDLNFVAIIPACFRMMKHEITPDNVLLMHETLPEATYYGLDMLKKHREFLGGEKSSEPIAPEHVCTTAVLRLLELGVGSKQYYEIVEKILKENPELAHGFPIVDLTHCIVKEVSHLSKHSNIVGNGTPKYNP